jgi:2-oxoglutarate dehydrogenase E2 component (dihydrolipoamide succinyltransferase)
MSTDIKVPALGESVTEATIARWFKKEGEAVKADEPLVELETDKVTVEVPSPASGVLTSIGVASGATVNVGAILGQIAEGAAGKAAAPVKKADAAPVAAAAAAPASAAVSPAVRKIAEEKKIDVSGMTGSGKDGRVTKGDLIAMPTTVSAPPVQMRAPSPATDASREERVKMTRLRATIARRLKDAQNTAAMLTTFNEVDMQPIFDLRKKYKEAFQAKHGVGLGFMSFFTLASVRALKMYPTVASMIDGEDMVSFDTLDISVAVSGPKGLMVPVVRNADQMSFAGVESTIKDLAIKVRDGKITLDEMTGGVFTITNGGVFGSMLSTPIINPPQSAILGMHKIQERPVVVNGQIVVRPMMYLALSYDHRLIDGADASRYLVDVKARLESANFQANLGI